MFPHHHLNHVQRSNAVFEFRKGINHEVLQITQLGRSFGGGNTLAKVALVDGVDLHRHAVVFGGITRQRHLHLGPGKATGQDD